MLSHQFDDLSGLQPELFPDGFERRPVFPSHLNYAVRFGREQFCHRSIVPA
ncbi:MAG: hypothetical protein ACI814_004181 [Mariniblastus sp.]|jgi:hypothetical protein